MSWTQAVTEIDEAIRLAASDKGDQALFAAERAIEGYAADLLGISIVELRAQKKTGRLQEGPKLRQSRLISAEQSELLEGFRKVRNIAAHPPFTISFDSRSLGAALGRLKDLIDRQAAPLHGVAVRDLYSTDPDAPAVHVAEVMAVSEYTFVPVFVDDEPVGTVNERSIVELFGDAGSDVSYLDRTVSEIMTEPLAIYPGGESVHTIVAEIQRHGAVLIQLRKCWGIYTIWDYADHSGSAEG